MRKKLYNQAFIDSQNLNLGIRHQDWSLDFIKFRRYLANKHGVHRAYLFLGYMPQYENLYNKLRAAGYRLVFKPVIIDKFGKVKGNVDAELVLQAMYNYRKYNQAVIVSGDGDFHCLVKFLERNNKIRQLIIPNRFRYSRLLKRSFTNVPTTFMNELKSELTR